jgi:regulator of protease activity HflC (stomatin/prohibitin superfamily)
MANPVDKLRATLGGLGSRLVLPGLCVLILAYEFLAGAGGCVEIKPGEVGVKYNNTGVGVFGSGTETVVDQGVQTFLPGLQSFEKLERRPQILVMADEEKLASSKRSLNVGGYSLSGDVAVTQRVRGLTVRAKDGSNFYFDVLEVHYQLIPSAAAKVIEGLGPGDNFKQSLVAKFSRGILRDEFGKFSFLEIADPTTYSAATSDARRRLNEVLSPFGVEVIQIVTPKPRFDERVEHAIEARQNAEQEIEVQAEKRRKLEQESGLKVQAVEQSKNAEYQTLLAELEANKKGADNKLLSVRREADKYFIERQAAANAYRDEKVTRAKANEVAYRKEAEALAAKIAAVGAQGPAVLDSVIAKHVFPQLKRIKASPISRPSAPIDIRHLDRKGN